MVCPAFWDAVARRQIRLPRSSVRLRNVGTIHTELLCVTASFMHRTMQKKSSTSVASG